jgi:hypothetical protein
MDCGVQYITAVMEFDHVRGVKTSSLSEMVSKGKRPDQLDEEIAKCDLVCANCHRIRTVERREYVDHDTVP